MTDAAAARGGDGAAGTGHPTMAGTAIDASRSGCHDRSLFPVQSASWPGLAVCVALAAFFTLLLAIPDILVPDPGLGWVDAWYYASFMQWLPDNLRDFPYVYQGDRIAWTLPGYLINRVATPIVANYLLKGAYFVVTVVFLFGTLHQTSSLRTAAFVSLLAALYSFLVHSIGANYSDGAANALFLMVVYAINREIAGHGSPGRNAFLAGAGYVGVLLAHFVFSVVLPMFAGYVVVKYLQSDNRSLRRFLVMTCGFLAGAVAAYVATAVLYEFWGLQSWPLFKSFYMLYSHTPNAHIEAGSAWWLSVAFWLVLPTFVVAWVLLDAGRSLRKGLSGLWHLPASYWFLLAMYGGWLVVYFVAKSPWLMIPFYVNYLIPPTFLALGPLVSPFVDRLAPRAYGGILCLLLLLAAAAYSFADPRYAAPAVVVGIAALSLATVVLQRRPAAGRWREPAFAALLVVAVAAIDFATSDYATQIRNGFKFTPMALIYSEPVPGSRWATGREAFKSVLQAGVTLRPRLYGRQYRMWYDRTEPLGMFFRSVGSLFFMWERGTLLNEDFRELDEAAVTALIDRPDPDIGLVPDILVLTSRPDIVVTDRRVRLQWTQRLSAAGIRYYAHYFETRPPDGSDDGAAH